MDKELIEKIKAGKVRCTIYGEGIPTGDYNGLLGENIHPSQEGFDFVMKAKLAHLIKELGLKDGTYTASNFGTFTVKNGRLDSIK